MKVFITLRLIPGKMNTNVMYIVAATLVLVFSTTLSNAQWTPDPFCPFPSDHVTRYPYYGNCSVYWECYEGAKYVMECPKGLEFNAPLQQCDAPEIANCDPYASTTGNPDPHPTYTTDKTTSSDDDRDPTCPYPSEVLVFFPYPGDCTKYWECYEGHKYLYTCRAGLWWHQEITNCDYPGPYCDNSTTTTTRPTTPVGPIPDCPNPPPEYPVYFPYYGDCTKYWECSDGKEYLYDCPKGLWWHQEISECDYPGPYCDNSTSTATPTTTTTTPTTTTTTTTQSTTTSTTTQPTTTTPDPFPQCSTNDTAQEYFPYPGDCTKYFECSNGKRYLYDCPDGLWWHQEIIRCDYPGPYCNPYSCSNDTTKQFYPYPGDCSKYFECSNGKLYLYSCPGGLWWHQEISECDYPGPYCDNSTTILPPTLPPTSPQPFVCNGTSTSYWPNPTNCHKYIECLKGVAYNVDCPKDLYFSDNVKECVSADKSECCKVLDCNSELFVF